MTVIDGRTWLEVLPERTCWELVGSEPIGRLSVVVGACPEIYPVNHVVDGLTVVFRTDAGSKLDGLTEHRMVCFEVDGVDERHELGWSVMVKGRAVRMDTDSALRRVEGLPVRPWARGTKEHWVRIDPVEITGRRIRPPTRQ